MKFVKRIVIFFVLCLAAYGVYTLLKKPPQLDVPESDLSYLLEVGIPLQDGRASESGLSGVLGNVEGVAPIGTPMSNSSGTESSAPPSFLVAPTTSYAAPFEPASCMPVTDITNIELQPAPEFSSPVAVPLPSPTITEPSDLSIPINTPPLEVHPLESPPIPIAASPPPSQSSPPFWKTWDGPAANIPVMSPPAETLQPFPLSDTHSHINENIAYQPIGRNIRQIKPDSGGRNSPSVSDRTFSTTDSVPLETAPKTTPVYTKTSARQPLSFEPVKPEILPNAPVVSFTSPKRNDLTQQPQQPVQPELPVDTRQPVQESVEKFVKSQRLLVESGDPENIRRAFVQLSQLYEHNQLGDPDRAMIRPLLDMLALKVIYAKDTHILEPPYRVKSGETVETIAKDFNLTPVLLQKINGLTMSHELPVGTTLKVVFGQFDARISVKRKELTLLLGGLYAGRFSFSLPNTGIQAQGSEFYVTKRTDRSIALNNGWVLATADVRGATVVFADHDAQEIFDILSEQSVVVLE